MYHVIVGSAGRLLLVAPITAAGKLFPSADSATAHTSRQESHASCISGTLAQSALAAGLGVGAVVLALFLAAAQREAEEARRRTEDYRRIEAARQDLTTFRRLADEKHFFAGLILPPGTRHLQFDPQRGQAAGQQALQLAETLQEDHALPAPEEKVFREEYRDLLLLTVQMQVQARAAADEGAVRGLLETLHRAESLGAPTCSLYRLRARCYELLGQKQLAGQADEHARACHDSAADRFLEAEWLRGDAEPPSASTGAEWKPDAVKLARAVDHYHKAIQNNPDHFWSYWQLGRCYLSLGKGPEALESLGTCVALRPQQPWGYSVRGLAFALVGRMQEAQADLDKALDLEKDFSPALLNRGLLFLRQKKHDQGLADFNRVLALPPGKRLSEAAYYRGHLYLEQGERARALADFQRVIWENPSFRPAYLGLAEAYFRAGNADDGLAVLTTLVNLDRRAPLDARNWELHAQRGWLLRPLVAIPAGGKAALADLEEAVQRGGKTPELYYDLGWVAMQLGQTRKALDYFTRAIGAEPAQELRIGALNLRGWIYAQSLEPPDYDKAREDFSQTLLLDSANAEAHTGLGYVRARTSKIAPAQSEASKALLHGAHDYRVLHNVACIHAELAVADKGQATMHADTAMDLVRRAVELARQGENGPRYLGEIRNEASFHVLKDRADFRKLLAEKSSSSVGFRADSHVPR